MQQQNIVNSIVEGIYLNHLVKFLVLQGEYPRLLGMIYWYTEVISSHHSAVSRATSQLPTYKSLLHIATNRRDFKIRVIIIIISLHFNRYTIYWSGIYRLNYTYVYIRMKHNFIGTTRSLPFPLSRNIFLNLLCHQYFLKTVVLRSN